MNNLIALSPVVVTGAVETEANTDGEIFTQIELSQDQIVPTNAGGNKAQTRTIKLITNWSMDKAKKMVGKEIPGNIIRVECPEYEWERPDGTKVKLTHTYVLG